MGYPFDVNSWMHGHLVYGGTPYFVDSTHANKSNQPWPQGNSPSTPFSTLAYAITQATASKGDVIVLMPGHAETTTAIAMSKAGVKVIGLGYGRNRPTLTATTATSDLINVTAANVELENFRLVGAASGCTALLDCTAADLVCRNMSFEQAATPLSGVTISGSRFIFDTCTWMGTSNGPDRCISIEAHLTDWQILNCKALFGAFGLDNEFLYGNDKAQVGYLIDNLVVVGCDTLCINIASSTSAPPDGYMPRAYFMMSAPIASTEDGLAAGTMLGLCLGWDVQANDTAGTRGTHAPFATAH